MKSVHAPSQNLHSRLNGFVRSSTLKRQVKALRRPTEDYGWLLLKLIQLFGSDRVVIGDAEQGKSVGIGVWNGKSGASGKRHAMWVERDTPTGHFSLNALPEEKRDTLVRHFLKACKAEMGWT